MSFFHGLSTIPEDPIFSLMGMYAKDQHPQKVNLGIGIYKDAAGKSVTFNSVAKAEKLIQEKNSSKDYLPIDGDPAFINGVVDLIFGMGDPYNGESTIYAVQSVGGTSALSLGMELIVRHLPRPVYISELSWANHFQIFRSLGIDYKTYPYAIVAGTLDFAKMCAGIEEMPEGALVMLHACCHNPTGVDLSSEQWQELSRIIKKRNLLPFFDFAYQGFASSIADDAAAVRIFHSQGHEMLVAYSCSKNFGLYGERCGVLALVAKGKETSHISSHVKMLIRTNYSNAPIHGSRIVSTILGSEALKNEWQEQLKAICGRCQDMRQKLASGLAPSGKDFSFLAAQKGLFSLLGLSKDDVMALRNDFGVFMPDNGRINIAALTDDNMDYVCHAIIQTLNRYR
jgi:aspartate aminotransferase